MDARGRRAGGPGERSRRKGQRDVPSARGEGFGFVSEARTDAAPEGEESDVAPGTKSSNCRRATARWTPSLRSLDARRNKRRGALAESVGRMRMLTSLRLDSNDLSSLPEGLGT